MFVNLITIVLVFTKFPHSDLLPIASTSDGLILGQYLASENNRIFSSFTGIPYAEPPVGDLRFQAPKPVKAWNGVFNATTGHKVCPQNNPFLLVLGEEMSEDCLFLNVYTPQRTFSVSKSLPVILFIHGGGFETGSANRYLYNPAYIMDLDVVLVTVNYRLGALGFLATGDTLVPGNNGLKDQNLAIKWAKQNIGAFGGNPDKITLLGQSVGGASAHFHMLSPLSKDLISGVISLSGTANAHWAFATNDETVQNSRKLAMSLNCSTSISREMVECLKKISFKDILNPPITFYIWNSDPMMPFKPTSEPEHIGSFITTHPIDVIKSGNVAKVPFVTGTLSEDGALKSISVLEDPHLLKAFNEEYMKIAPLTFFYRTHEDYISDTLRKFYFNDTYITNSSIDASRLTNAYTDAMFLSFSNEAVWLHTKYTSHPVYYYILNHRGKFSFAKLVSKSSYNYGVYHADDVQYVFKLPIVSDIVPPSPTDIIMRNVLTELWTNFAKTGEPTPKLSSLIHNKWKPVSSENLEYYLLGTDIPMDMHEKPFWNRTILWKTLGNRH